MNEDSKFRCNLYCDSDITKTIGNTISRKCYKCKHHFFILLGTKEESNFVCYNCSKQGGVPNQ